MSCSYFVSTQLGGVVRQGARITPVGARWSCTTVSLLACLHPHALDVMSVLSEVLAAGNIKWQSNSGVYKYDTLSRHCTLDSERTACTTFSLPVRASAVQLGRCLRLITPGPAACARSHSLVVSDLLMRAFPVVHRIVREAQQFVGIAPTNTVTAQALLGPATGLWLECPCKAPASPVFFLQARERQGIATKPSAKACAARNTSLSAEGRIGLKQALRVSQQTSAWVAGSRS